MFAESFLVEIRNVILCAFSILETDRYLSLRWPADFRDSQAALKMNARSLRFRKSRGIEVGEDGDALILPLAQ